MEEHGHIRVVRATLASRYQVEREIGRGAFATVFLASDLKYQRDVAVKVLKPEWTNAVAHDRFLLEIKLTAQLNHPNILPLLDSGEAGGLLFYVMPYVSGGSLRARLRRERQLGLEEALRIAHDVASGLAAAHAGGVVHRDVKPENILLDAERAVLSDFGICRVLADADAERITSSGLGLGTPGYMSPEQATGERNLDQRSDVYSLGCVVYEMLAGETPYTGPSAQAIVAKKLSQPVPSIRTLRETIPPALDSVLQRALAKVPADRYAGARDFAQAMEQAALDHGSRWWRQWLARRPWRWAVAAAIVLVGLGGSVLAIRSARRFHGRDWLMVADFHGPADDPDLAASVRELVTAEMNQSRYVQILPRNQINSAMRLAGIPETTFVDSRVARELAYRTSIRALLLGDVSRLGPKTYSLALHVMDAETERGILSVAAPATDTGDQLVTAVQSLARRVRQGLGERPEAIAANRPLIQIATASFGAFQKYAAAIGLQARGDVAGSNALLRQAVDLDPGFASAWLAMGMNYITGRNLDSAAIALTAARSRPDRLTNAQRYRLEADGAYAIRHDLPAAVRWYELYLAEAPWSYGGRNNRGLYLASMGRHEEALAEFQRALSANPLGPELQQIEVLNASSELIVLGRPDEAQRLAPRLSGPFAQQLGLLLATAGDSWGAAESLAAGPAHAPRSPGYLRVFAGTTLAAAQAALGHPQRAAFLLDSLAAAATGSTVRWYAQGRVLLSLASEIPMSPMPEPLARDTTPAGLAWKGIWLVAANDTARALRFAATLHSRDSLAVARLGWTPAYLDASLAWRRRRWADVVKLLDVAAREGEHDATSLDRVGSHAIRWLVASAYANLGRADSALAYLDRLNAPLRIPPGHLALRGLVVDPAERMRHQLAAGRPANGRTFTARGTRP